MSKGENGMKYEPLPIWKTIMAHDLAFAFRLS